jgi:hypothetical protein
LSSLVISTGRLVLVAAGGAVILLASSSTSYALGSPPTPTVSSDMPGMDMTGKSPASTPEPTIPFPETSDTHPDGAAHSHGSTTNPSTSGGMPGMDMPSDGHDHGAATGAVAPRPLAPVLGTFGGGSAAVMLAAGVMRRKDRQVLLARKAARAARRSGI